MSMVEKYQEIEEHGYDFSIGEVFDRSWKIFTDHIWYFIGITLIAIIVTIILGTIPVAGAFLSTIFSTFIMAGYYIVCFKIIRGESFTLENFFGGGRFLLTLILASLLSGLLTLLGGILILPGIYLTIAYLFINNFIIDKDLDVWSSMEYSRKIITKRWFLFLWLGILLALMNIVGIVLAGVGLLVSIPYSMIILAVVYEQIVGVERS